MLKAFPYHQKVVQYFKQQPKTWDYFALAKTREGQLQAFKNELLKSSYKFHPSSDAFIYDKVAVVKDKLDLDMPVWVYQAQHSDELNASIVYIENEAHIVFSGPITRLLNDEELLAIVAHELSHVKLYTLWEKQVEVADRIITAIANNHNSEPSYYETARIFKLYTEIFCDRGAYIVVGDIHPVITSLVKMATGLDKVNAENYLNQAEEIFTQESELTTSRITHPENFIRARSLRLWREESDLATEKISGMIEERTTLDHLDIFQQKDLSAFTKFFLQLYLKPKWIQTSLILSHAKQFFSDFVIDENIVITDTLKDLIEKYHYSIHEYLCYLLLDFALADAELDLVPMGRAFGVAEQMTLKDVFERIVKKELELNDKKTKDYREKCLLAYNTVQENEGSRLLDNNSL